MVFIFQFVNMVYHIDWFEYIEESLHPWNKPNLIMVFELFDVLLNSVIFFKFCWGFLHLYSSVMMISGEGNGTPPQHSCLENPKDGGSWWAAVYGVAKSQTRLSDFTFMHWRRKWQPTPVFLPGVSQGRQSLVGCRLWGRTESDTTEAT